MEMIVVTSQFFVLLDKSMFGASSIAIKNSQFKLLSSTTIHHSGRVKCSLVAEAMKRS